MAERKDGFTQVCVWPGTVLGADNVAEFEQFFKDEMGTRVQYLEEILTYPDIKDGMIVDGTGGRNDLFFAVHDEDIGKFAIPRLTMGIRWYEDVVDNGGLKLYPNPDKVNKYYSWEKEAA
jgi:hypothetical protein